MVYSMLEVMDMVDYLVRNTYVRAFGRIFTLGRLRG